MKERNKLKSASREVDILLLRVDSGERERRRDAVAVEEPLHILINGEHYATILCTPLDGAALAVGNIVSEGLVNSVEDIREVKAGRRGTIEVVLKEGLDLTKRLDVSASFKRLVLSSCGSVDHWPFSKLIDRLKVPRVKVEARVRADVVLEGVRRLNTYATTFRETGGVHAAALYSHNGELAAFSEDVGRHNAVDKVIGLALSEGCRFEEHFLASTGRLTGDIVLKAARVKVPIVASLASAIDSGVEVARRSGITLIGFVRGNRMNVYTFPERIIL